DPALSDRVNTSAAAQELGGLLECDRAAADDERAAPLELHEEGVEPGLGRKNGFDAPVHRGRRRDVRPLRPGPTSFIAHRRHRSCSVATAKNENGPEPRGGLGRRRCWRRWGSVLAHDLHGTAPGREKTQTRTTTSAAADEERARHDGSNIP